jgi:hypothetical protein
MEDKTIIEAIQELTEAIKVNTEVMGACSDSLYGICEVLEQTSEK